MNIAIFASGNGTNAGKIIEKCKQSVRLIVCSSDKAGVTEIARKHKVPLLIIKKDSFYSKNSILKELSEHQIEFIALAGFLWMLPPVLIKAFPKKILNLHPALLPKFGGKGMYGLHVHRAVIEKREKLSGISIHFVNEKYDEGAIIFQAACEVSPKDAPETLAKKIQKLEHKHYPEVIFRIAAAYDSAK